jgi:hypothetical protein
LFQNLIMDQILPLVCCNKIAGADSPCNSEESCSPGDEVVLIDCWVSCHNSIKIIGELLGSLDALSATQ